MAATHALTMGCMIYFKDISKNRKEEEFRKSTFRSNVLVKPKFRYVKDRDLITFVGT